MTNKVSISVVIPCFNHGRYIKEAIKSVEQCDKQLYELIIVNDGSTDAETCRILQQLSDDGYLVINQSNKGLGAARNAGIQVAKGEYILPLDSDNKIRPSFLPLAIEVLEKSDEIGVVYGDGEYFGERSGRWAIPNYDADAFFTDNYIDACSVYRKTLWDQVGGYDSTMPLQGYEDWDFWIMATKANWKFHHLGEIVFDYRVSANSMNAEYRRTKVPQVIREYLYSKHNEFFHESYKRIHSNSIALKYYRANPAASLKFLSKSLASKLVSKGNE